MTPTKTLCRSLLLLPPPPSPPTFVALKAAYGPVISGVYRKLLRSPQRTQDPVILDIALPCTHLDRGANVPRSVVYPVTQKLVAGVYKMLCIIATQLSIDPEDAEGVDPRILLLAYPRDGRLNQGVAEATPEQEIEGPVVDIHTLALAPRLWDTIYSVETEKGEELLKRFLSANLSHRKVSKLRGGITQVSGDSSNQKAETSTGEHHPSVAVGGTFDHLHIGHKLLLTMTAFMPSRDVNSSAAGAPLSITVGITGDELLKNKKYAEYLESWEDRRRSTHEFLSSILFFGQPGDARIRTEEKTEPGPNGHAVHVTYPSNLVIKYVEISDPFGPTITDKNISALVISGETRSGGKAVNDKRAENGWAPLEVFEVDVLDTSEEEQNDETFQSKLSSTEIRRLRSERLKSKSKV